MHIKSSTDMNDFWRIIIKHKERKLYMHCRFLTKDLHCVDIDIM